MTQAQLDAMEASALLRLQEFINRSAGQHMRAWKKTWGTAA